MAELPNSSTLIPLGISACLLGQPVRYDGEHKHSEFCTQVLARYFRFTAFCPEVAIGMGIPREPIRLIGNLDHARAVGSVRHDLDVTAPLTTYADSVRSGVSNLRGYIFMENSPSCGLFSTKVYSTQGALLGKRPGLFAERLRNHFPLIPMEECSRLNDPALRENFIARVHLYDRWKNHMENGITPRKLVEFHSQHKYFVMAFGQKLYRESGSLVARAGTADIDNLSQNYLTRLMVGTQNPPTRKGHVNALSHMAGYLGKFVPGGTRRELADSIEAYRLSQVPLAVPVKLLNLFLDKYGTEYIRRQIYLNPYPDELRLRDHI